MNGNREMSLLLIEPLIATASATAASALWDVVRNYIDEKNQKSAPNQIQDEEDIRKAAFIIEETNSKVSESEPQEITNRALSSAHESTNSHRLVRLNQARITFQAALILSVLGILIIFAGVALVLLKDLSLAGAITAVVGAITEAVSAIIFKLNHETNNRLDEIGRDMRVIEAAQISMTLIAKIEDPKKRDDAIRDAAMDLRKLGSTAGPHSSYANS